MRGSGAPVARMLTPRLCQLFLYHKLRNELPVGVT